MVELRLASHPINIWVEISKWCINKSKKKILEHILHLTVLRMFLHENTTMSKIMHDYILFSLDFRKCGEVEMVVYKDRFLITKQPVAAAEIPGPYFV